MQLIWLSGPTSRVVTVSIGLKTVLCSVAALALTLVALGGVLQLLGIRIAVDVRPDLARSLGGVTSASEQQRVEQQLREQLVRVQGRVDALSGQLQQLERTKQAMVGLIGDPPVAAAGAGAGRGGPLRRLLALDWFAPRAVDGLVRLDEQSQDLSQRSQRLQQLWQAELQVLQALPLRSPIDAAHERSSDFGVRRDPFTGGFARHEGIDFVAPAGTPVQATAAGTVVTAEPSGAYGLLVEIDHGHGLSTRYAHNSRLEVTRGQTVQAGQVVSRLGSTGRSTGPHLHYEVRIDGRAIDPGAREVLQATRGLQRQRTLALMED